MARSTMATCTSTIHICVPYQSFNVPPSPSYLRHGEHASLQRHNHKKKKKENHRKVTVCITNPMAPPFCAPTGSMSAAQSTHLTSIQLQPYHPPRLLSVEGVLCPCVDSLHPPSHPLLSKLPWRPPMHAYSCVSKPPTHTFIASLSTNSPANL